MVDVLGQLYAPEWVNAQNRCILVRYYTTVCAEQLEEQAGAGINELNLARTRFRFVWARISDQEHFSIFPWLIHNPGENRVCVVESVRRVLPDSLYVLCAAPIENGQWELAARSLDAAVGLLRQAFGNNIAHSFVRQAIVNVDTGRMETPTGVLRVPQTYDGPWLERDRWNDLDEILNALTERVHLQKRVSLAFELLEKGYQESGPSKFFYLWSSLEVVWGTHNTNKLRQALERAYAANASFVVNQLGFAALTKLRQAVIHDGELIAVAQDVEVYMQRLFLDLIRQRLDLPCQRLVEKYIQGGFDLRRLAADSPGYHLLNIRLNAPMQRTTGDSAE